ncbi:FCD domain-containing protein [Xanthobacter dioxanivorans]|uniref:FCD domain-containing protein n=1 Tax=Xanthobacter dioxanivorans TaxID=2528964 RepID=A0A974SIH6_9HYPH|nr:GntR family transcriptional regulator [Xanthobacter dioxanivorans]QRG05378.1 FCD domain-containing protein [Xanthobacter dioxanivorans]
MPNSKTKPASRATSAAAGAAKAAALKPNAAKAGRASAAPVRRRATRTGAGADPHDGKPAAVVLDMETAAGEGDPKTLGEGIYARLRSDLIAGRITPGTRLPFRQLSARYEVGIGPLREALVRLASERLVDFEGQRGFMAAPLSLKDLNDLCQLRIQLSCQALRDSIARGGEDWEDEILVALHRLVRSPLPSSSDDNAAIDEWERRHDRFHTSLIAACESRWLLHFCATLSDQCQRYRRFIVLSMAQSYSLFDEVRSQHQAMAEAVLARRADEAEVLLMAHYRDSLARVMEQMESFVRRKRA